MAIQIAMCGGRRTGKTSVLAAIQQNIQEQYSDGSIVFNMDKHIVNLVNHRDNYLHLNDDEHWESPYYYPAEQNGTFSRTDYPATIRFGKKKLPMSVNFVDVPGEWYAEPHARQDILKALKGSEILLVAVDTPHLVENAGEYHAVMNRPEEIASLAKEAWQKASTPKMILFTLVKCELYMHNGRMREVLDRVEKGYKSLIAYAKSLSQGCEVAVVSCETIGGMEFSHFEQPDPNAPPFFTDASGVNHMNLRAAYMYLLDQYGEHYYRPAMCEQPLLYCMKYVLKRCADRNFFLNFISKMFGAVSKRQLDEIEALVDTKLVFDEDKGYRRLNDPFHMFR